MNRDHGPSWRWWAACWGIPTGSLIILAIVLGHSSLDVWLMQPFYDPAVGGFPLRHHWFFAVVLHTTAKWLAVFTPLAACGIFLSSWWWAAARPWRWPTLYLALCAGGTTAVVGIIRETTNHYSPWSMNLFGGQVPWTPLFTGTPAPFIDGHSFPAAHAAGAFAWISLWFVGRHFATGRTWWWLLPGLIGGLLFAWTQHVRGEHFPSHNLWTLAIAWTVASGLAMLAARLDLMSQASTQDSALVKPLQTTMTISTRSWLIGTTGLFIGSMLFSIDTAVVELHIGPEKLHFWIECAEFILIGPGLGVLCLLLTERLRAMRITVAAHQLAEREQRFLILGRMAASVAHEVRNPLHTLRLVVDELRVEQPALHAHPLSAHIDDSLERIDRAVDLVYQLARPGTEVDSAGDIVIALRDAQTTRSLHLQNRVITCDKLPENAAVRCSASSLRIIIDNLLRNAVQATTEGDTISVTLRRDHHRWVLRIRNPGHLPTLPTAHRDALPAASHKEDGLGLGLTITRQLASNADGNLELISDGDFVTAELTLLMWQESANALTKESPT